MLNDRTRILASVGLADYARAVTKNSHSGDVKKSAEAVGNFFCAVRGADMVGMLSDKSMKAAMSFWNEHVETLFNISPVAALYASANALEACKFGKRPCDIAILNGVCAKINSCIRPALDEELSKANCYIPAVAIPFLDCAEDVIKVTAPHGKSAFLQDSFFEALTVWENILFSRLMPPAARYDRVVALEQWAEASTKSANGLKSRLADIRNETIFSANGVPLLLNVAEEMAEEIATETKQAKNKNAIDIHTAFAIRAGLPASYASLYHDVESAMAHQHYGQAADLLYDLFVAFSCEEGEKTDDDDDESNHVVTSIDPAVLSYWRTASNMLQGKAPDSAFHLVSRCVQEIDSSLLISEDIQDTVYGVALPVIAEMEMQGSEYKDQAKNLYKLIMQRVPEFVDDRKREEYFECAAEGLTACLIEMSPSQRYAEIHDLSVWIGDSDRELPLLNDFVGQMLAGCNDYGNEKVILFPEDDTPLSGTASVIPVSFPQPS